MHRPHMLLGMTIAGIVDFCRRIQFPVHGEEVDGYRSRYRRDEAELGGGGDYVDQNELF